jgi:hypothetical protein
MDHMQYKRILTVAALPVLFAGVAWADDAPAEAATDSGAGVASQAVQDVSADEAAQENPSRRSGGHSKQAFFEKYDVNGDGKVSEAEFMAERQVGYIRRDANADGAVHSEEYVSEYEVRLLKDLEDQRKRQIDQAEFRFNVLDKDEDGILSEDEFHASGTRMFTSLDTNGDGLVDEADGADSY